MARSAIVIAFTAVLAAHASYAQSPLEQAVPLARARRYAEAQQLLKDVAEPTVLAQRIAFHRLKAAIAAGLNDSAAAAAEMQLALAVAPADPALLLATAVAELNADQLDAALSHATAAVRLDPVKEECRVTLAFALIRGQNFPQAIDSLKAAIETFPKSSRLRTLLGIAQFAAGDSEDALSTLSRAIAVDSAAEPAYRSLAQIVLQSSAAPDAVIIAQLCSWNVTVCSALKLRAARETGDVRMQADAIAALERAPEADIIARCELARAREWAGRLPEARAEMEKCVAAAPSPQNHYRLGLIYQRLGLAALAQKQMELRRQMLGRMSEQTASGLSALAALK